MIADFLIGTLLLLSASFSLQAKDNYRAGLFLITFGFLSGLVWVRLEAPDVALVEFLLGGALTGLLLFKLLRSVKARRTRASTGRKLWAGLVSVLLLLYLLSYLSTLKPQERLAEEVFQNLHRSGVESPVTAVLLNFRGYDTLLEVGVITLALLGILALKPREEDFHWKNPLPQSLAKGLMPPIAFFSLYVTYLGGYSVGGAFQGGALLTGGLLFLALTGLPLSLGAGWSLFLASLSLLVFAGVGLVYALLGYGFLTYPPALASLSIVLIELSICLSTALLLYVAYRGRL